MGIDTGKTMASLLCGYWDPNLGPLGCQASTFPTELSAQPQNLGFRVVRIDCPGKVLYSSVSFKNHPSPETVLSECKVCIIL